MLGRIDLNDILHLSLIDLLAMVFLNRIYSRSRWENLNLRALLVFQLLKIGDWFSSLCNEVPLFLAYHRQWKVVRKTMDHFIEIFKIGSLLIQIVPQMNQLQVK